MILRMPERFLPLFLKQLKQDYINKRAYLKYLRVSSKFIKCCQCNIKQCHSYCITAFVLRSQKIFCKDCNGYFQLHVRQERIFSTEYLGGLMKISIPSIIFGVLIYLVYLLDKKLKNDQYIKDETNNMNLNDTSSAYITEFQRRCKDRICINNDYVLFPMTFVLVVIMIWCFYLKVVINFMRRKRLLWVEVQDCVSQEY